MRKLEIRTKVNEEENKKIKKDALALGLEKGTYLRMLALKENKRVNK